MTLIHMEALPEARPQASLALPERIDLNAPAARLALPILLQDKTTSRNIIWATNSYEAFGEEYAAKREMTVQLVTALPPDALKPRAAKAWESQRERTRKHAEVFTPAWICNRMNNQCDISWFHRRGRLFNRETPNGWETNAAPISFRKGQRWQRYVDRKLLEITCGEAPFLVSRYDAATGMPIPLSDRVGLLDRKLRVVSERAPDEATWLRWAKRAFESIYGYEFQGDNLLLARLNLLMTYGEYLQARWGRQPTDRELKEIANVIAWNLWQMDGLKGTVPFGSLTDAEPQISMWEMLGEGMRTPSPDRPKCVFYDWRGRAKRCFTDRRRKKGPPMKFDFVIGNPPYQDDTVNDGDRKPPVYHYFMDASYKVADVVELITPARIYLMPVKHQKAGMKRCCLMSIYQCYTMNQWRIGYFLIQI